MKTNRLLSVIVALVLAITGALSASAAGALTVSRTGMTTDGTFNYLCFDVEAPADGSYYAELWLCPAKHKDGSYTNYGVYVNYSLVGKITPVAGKWQSITLDNNTALELTEGTNTVIIATPADELPDIETIRVASTRLAAKIDSEAYEQYLADAKIGVQYDTPNENEGLSTYAGGVGTIFRTGLNLGYSFYKVVYLQNGEYEPNVMTKSTIPHVIDVVMIGTPTPEYKPAPNPIDKNIYPDIVNPDNWEMDTTLSEFDKPFKWVKPEIMANNSWYKTARKAGSYYKASLELDIPFDAYYLVRVRSQEEGVLGVLDEVSIIDDYKGLDFEEEPICFTKAKCELPADGTTYLTMTNCYDPNSDDPMLFMHGTDEKVIGFNDNGRVNAIYDFTRLFNLSERDAVLTQSYKTPTAYVSVCSKSTLETYSKCSILSGLDAYEEIGAALNRISPENAMQMSDEPVGNTDEIAIPKAVSLSSNIKILSDKKINSVKIYDVFGNFKGSAKGDGNIVEVPVSSFNIVKSGIYVVSVETVTGIESGRMFVK